MRIGLVLNPFAGIGGAVGLQGSDGPAKQAEALARGGIPRAVPRVQQMLDELKQCVSTTTWRHITWLSWAGDMGAELLATQVEDCTICGRASQPSSAADTHRAACALIDAGADLLVFAGGDGTARDVLAAINADESRARSLVLGVPAGVKMHSGVFAIGPSAAANVIAGLLEGELIGKAQREVRDYIEVSEGASAASASIKTQHYGELWVPEASGYLQQTKIAGKESEALVVADICAYLGECFAESAASAWIIGPGSSCLALKQSLGCVGTLLGCDVVFKSGAPIVNATVHDLEAIARNHSVDLVVSFTRHQGFLFGRGNQQLSGRVLSGILASGQIRVIGSRTKLNSLKQRPLLVDSGDVAVDRALSGFTEIITGYDDRVLYRVQDQAADDT